MKQLFSTLVFSIIVLATPSAFAQLDEFDESLISECNRDSTSEFCLEAREMQMNMLLVIAVMAMSMIAIFLYRLQKIKPRRL